MSADNVGKIAQGVPLIGNPEAPSSIAPGVAVTRRKIFECPAIQPGWPVAMLQHIEIAKSLGATTFEINTRVTKAPRPQATSYMSRMFGYDAEPWQGHEEIDVTLVTIYAVVVE